MKLQHNSTFHLVSVVCFLLLGLSACAGYRMGYFSMPYIGEKAPPHRTSSNSYNLSTMKRIKLQDFTLTVDLNNEIQTSHTAWAGPVPLRMDLENRSLTEPTSMHHHCIEIRFIPEQKDIVFSPEKVVLIIDGVAFPVKNTLFIQYENYKKESSAISNDPIPLVDLGNTYSYDFSLCFETVKPTPDQVIQLDLTRAIQVSGQEKGQMIHFKKNRYRHGYT